MNTHLINAKPISQYTPDEFAYHLRSIINHDAKRRRDKKIRAKERVAAYASAKPKARPWSFRLSPKGSAVITIRGRKPPYIYQHELDEMLSENSDYSALIHASIVKRKIVIKPGGPE